MWHNHSTRRKTRHRRPRNRRTGGWTCGRTKYRTRRLTRQRDHGGTRWINRWRRSGLNHRLRLQIRLPNHNGRCSGRRIRRSTWRELLRQAQLTICQKKSQCQNNSCLIHRLESTSSFVLAPRPLFRRYVLIHGGRVPRRCWLSVVQPHRLDFAGLRSAAFAHEEARRGRDAAASLFRGGIIGEPAKTRKPDSTGSRGNLRNLRPHTFFLKPFGSQRRPTSSPKQILFRRSRP